MTLPTGPAYGIQTSGDVLVNRTADGVPLETIWQELIDLFNIENTERTALLNLLSYFHTEVASAVPQVIEGTDFEEATELGVPKSAGPPSGAALLGFRLRDLDRASRFGWRFLRDANAEQVRAVIESIIHADRKLVMGLVLHRLFTPTPSKNEFNYPCYGLWTGDDGFTPPPYLGKRFTAEHSHYVASGAASLDSADIEDAYRNITEHGYGQKDTASQLLILANPEESEIIQSFRAGQESRSGGPEARFDFVPSLGAPPYLIEGAMVGQPVPATYGGLPVLGSYGQGLLVELNHIPPGYVSVVATAGPLSLNNVIGVREHVNPAYRGLRQIAGNWQNYPIIESFSVRSIGVGTRHRGAAVAIQVTTGDDYTAPDKTDFGISSSMSV
jgi:hypothetical protein